MDSGETYQTGAIITGIIAFIAGWIYAVMSYGWFLGLGLGWIPALVVGVIAGLLWPLIAIAIFLLVLLVMSEQ
jgi:hypothetical protein